MIVVFGAGHVLGKKSYMGYTEDDAMLDLARRKAEYVRKYGIEAHVMNVTQIASYQGIEDFIRGVHGELCSLEHSNADDSIDEEPNEPNRVVVYRTAQNPGDGPCRLIGQACADVLDIRGVFVENTVQFGAINRAMKAGCSDAWLIEHGFHTHKATREKLSDPAIRQQLAEQEVDAMATYYGWSEDMLGPGDSGYNVTYWQLALIKAGYSLPTWGANSEYNDETKQATSEFQRVQGLGITGIVDTTTFCYMCNALVAIDNVSQASLEAVSDDLEAANDKLAETTENLVKMTDERDEYLGFLHTIAGNKRESDAILSQF